LVERQPSKLDVAGSSPVARFFSPPLLQDRAGTAPTVPNRALIPDIWRRTMDQPLGIRLGAEALGTFLFFFLGFSGVAVVVDIGADAITPLGVAAGFGFGLALAITAFGHISGGHFNPAVSAGLVIAGRFSSRDVIPYWIAQLVGGFGAVLVMAIVYSSQVTDALHTQPGSGIDDWAALVLEIIATGLFVMVILTVATDERAAWNGVMAPFLIGLFIFTAAVTVGPASGGSFNPARSLDPVLWNQEWGDVWIYIVGPLAGGVLGGAIWAFLLLRKPPVPDPKLETARGGLEP
jgi:MIP family channel proteins